MHLAGRRAGAVPVGVSGSRSPAQGHKQQQSLLKTKEKPRALRLMSPQCPRTQGEAAGMLAVLESQHQAPPEMIYVC